MQQEQPISSATDLDGNPMSSDHVYAEDTIYFPKPSFRDIAQSILRDDSMWLSRCMVCDGGFTATEWLARHTPNSDPLAEVHDRCCPDCKEIR